MQFQIRYCGVVASTNDLARRAALEGAPEGLVILARGQTSGRGQKGRSYFSPAGTGLYLSLLLRPTCAPAQAPLLTTAAAAAAAEAIEQVSGRPAQIKWVNDIWQDGKKVCGILTEAAFLPDGERLDHAVVGVGVNLAPPPEGFPPELRESAGALFSDVVPGCRDRLARTFLERFAPYDRQLDSRSFYESYRARSLVLGRVVRVLGTQGEEPAFVEDLDRDCRLRVRYADGRTAVLGSGEVRVCL